MDELFSLEKSESTETYIDEALNFRGFAGYSSSVSPDAVTCEGFIYRSGNLSNITNKGWEKIRELPVSTVICLTDKNEAEALYANDSQSSQKVKGFKVLNFPFYQEEFDKTRLFAKYSGYASKGHSVCYAFPFLYIHNFNISAGHCSRLHSPPSRRGHRYLKHITSDPQLP